jgi:type III secretory pathway component EscR
MQRFVGAVLLSAALLAPIAVKADDDHNRRERIYDKSHKDYHEWNDQEDRAYRHYLEEHHRPYRDWKKANKRDQEAYWAWRHNHQDWH